MAEPEDALTLDPANTADTPDDPADAESPDVAGLEDRGRLPSFDDVNLTVGQFMAGLEQKILHNRPPAVVVVQEHARAEQVETNGLVIGNLPVEPLDRPEPPDDSGVTL